MHKCIGADSAEDRVLARNWMGIRTSGEDRSVGQKIVAAVSWGR
jgi:hypothetical protein